MKDGVITTVEQPLFVKKGRHELLSLLKLVEGGTGEAVQLLIDTMRNANEETKHKIKAAELLLDLEVKIKAEISRDQLTRQIAEIKAKGLSTPLTLEEKVAAPKTDFTQIQAVG